jgi:hypothetical protein
VVSHGFPWFPMVSHVPWTLLAVALMAPRRSTRDPRAYAKGFRRRPKGFPCRWMEAIRPRACRSSDGESDDRSSLTSPEDARLV